MTAEGTSNNMSVSTQLEDAGAFAVLDESIVELGSNAARIYRVATLMPGTHLTAQVLAAVLGISEADAGNALGELADANLVQKRRGDRFAPHSMIRTQSAYLAEREFTAVARTAIKLRAVAWYLARGQAADRKLSADRLRLPGCAPEAPDPLPPFADDSAIRPYAAA